MNRSDFERLEARVEAAALDRHLREQEGPEELEEPPVDENGDFYRLQPWEVR